MFKKFACLTALALLTTSAYSNGGVIMKVPEPESSSQTFKDRAGNTVVVIDKKVANTSEFELLAKARAYLVQEYGEKARKWPLATDPVEQTFSFYNENTEYITLAFE